MTKGGCTEYSRNVLQWDRAGSFYFRTKPETESLHHHKERERTAPVYLHELHSGATVYEAIGAYNMQKRNEIITIVDKGEYQKLMDYINREDPEAFITVYTVSEMRYRPKR